MRLAVVTLLTLLVFAAPAEARREWRFHNTTPMPIPSAFIVHAKCPYGSGACADVDNRTVYLPPGSRRFARYHELGHIYLETLDGYWKGAIMAHMGLNPARIAWDAHAWDCDPMAGDVCPGEMAADAYAACVMHLVPGRGRWWTNHDYLPSRRQQRKVCSAIRRSAR